MVARVLFVLAATLSLAPAALGDGQIPVSRHDVARCLFELERAIAENGPEPGERAILNRGFDRALRAFFRLRAREAARDLDAITESLRGRPRAAIQVRFEPPVAVAGREETTLLRWAPLHDRCGEGRINFRFLDERGQVVQQVEVPAGPGEIPLPPSVLELPPGDYDVAAERDGAFPATVARYSVLPRPAATLAREAIERVENVELPPNFHAARATLIARARLLADEPSQARGVQLVEPPFRLAREVRSEALAISSGKNPYHRLIGEIWRVLDPDGAGVPYRLFAPTAAGEDDPLPLVIALHGAGGDENLFLHGYGDGLLRDLAAERGFLVACPATIRFSTSPEVFDALLAEIFADYAVDPERVSVLGHSLGAGAAAILARARPDRIAAVALLAGSGSAKGLPVPGLRVHGALDPLFPAPSPAPGVRVYPDEGHALLVSRCLPEVVTFLLDPPAGKGK